MSETVAPSGALEVARGYFEAIAAADRGAQRTWYHPDARLTLQGAFQDATREEAIAWFDALYAAFGDLRFEVLHLVGDAERAAVHWRLAGTFTGPGAFEGFAANGGTMDTRGCDVVEARDGLVVAIDAYTDGMTILRQLGLMPPKGSAAERGMAQALNAKTRLLALRKR